MPLTREFNRSCHVARVPDRSQSIVHPPSCAPGVIVLETRRRSSVSIIATIEVLLSNRTIRLVRPVVAQRSLVLVFSGRADEMKVAEHTDETYGLQYRDASEQLCRILLGS